MSISTASLALLTAAVTCFAAPGLALAGPPASPGQAASVGASAGQGGGPLIHPDERHLANLRQLTFGGENAEAYFSADGKRLSLQATTALDRCDQIYHLDLGGDHGQPALQPVSGGHGRHTCSYFFPSGDRLLFSSTRHLGDSCPPPPDHSKGYVWPLYNYQIYTAKPDGSDVQRLTQTAGYEAESTICHDGSVIFTSDRDGDLELYRMNLDGTGVKRLTFAPGYDGGAFFSEDCQRIVWRAARPRNGAELEEMRSLLRQHLVRPTRMELWTANADGTGAHAVTDYNVASFAPFFYPKSLAGASDRRIIFSSNYPDARGREFDLWAVNSDGTDLERITFSADFDGFPIFSPDGKKLAFSSNRGGKIKGETNVFLADWRQAAPVAAAHRPTTADEVRSRIAWLADPKREGRGVGTPGLKAAGDQLVTWMKAAGLEPGGETLPGPGKKDRSFFQDVEVFVGVRDQGSKIRLEGAAGRDLPPTEAVAASMSSNGKFSGLLRFAGYGITANDANSQWDDLTGVDVKGQVAVVLRGVPANKFPGAAARSYSDLRFKAWNLREHGAQAVVLVDPTQDGVPKLTLDGPEGAAGLPVFYVSRAVLASLLATPPEAGAGPLAALEKAALDGKSGTVQLSGTLSGEIKLARESRQERNVIGLLRGTGSPGAPLPAVVLGAHYDHLGFGGRNSLAPGQKVVHPGADDNASGTVALLHTAGRLKASGQPLPADIYFAAFTGEEVGLVGSSRFVEKLLPELPKERIKAMLNFDMVGRLQSGTGGDQTLPTVVVQGSDSAAEWAELVAPHCQAGGLFCKLGGDGYGPSDMTPFYAAGVPVLFFFTGAHADYHRPSDTADKINALGVAEVAELAAGVVRDLSARLQKNPAGLTWKKPSGPKPRSGDRGYGAYLGTIPDYTAMQGKSGGVKLTGARPGSPAEQAGVKPGDTLVGLGESKIDTLEDMAFALKKYKPGETLDVAVLRGGQRVVLRATLRQRPTE